MAKVVFSFGPIRRVNVRKKIQVDGAWNFRALSGLDNSGGCSLNFYLAFLVMQISSDPNQLNASFNHKCCQAQSDG
jgi:hypothetical protein